MGTAVINNLLEQATPADNYGDLYQLTYNQQDAEIEPIVDFLKERRWTKGKDIMEIMAGNGFESAELRKIIPGNTYFASDIITYFDKIRGIKYRSADCTDITYNVSPASGEPYRSQQYDMVFIGGANASMCMLYTLKEIMRLAIFMQHTVKLNGYAVLSYFEEGFDTSSAFVVYSSQKVEMFKKYNGKYAHWFNVIRRDADKQYHQYYNLVGVTTDKEITEKTKFDTALFNSEIFTARSWQSAVVLEIMEEAGFEFVPTTKDLELDTRSMFFKKIKEKNRVSFID